LLATQFNMTSFGEVRFCFGKNASPALHFSKEVKAASRQRSSAFFGRGYFGAASFFNV